MMSDKVYIVYGRTKGLYDYSSSFIVGIYDTPEKADEAKQKYIAQVVELQGRYTEAQQAEYDKELEELTYEGASENARKYFVWVNDINTMDYSMEVDVREYTFNEQFFKLP